jgi:stress-induced-phosphoprotein 1
MQAEVEKNAGNEALKAGDFAKAAEHYSKAIELAPTQHVYFSNRSNAYVQLKRYEEALSDANKTIELDPSFARGYGRKGVALFFLGRYKDAAAAYSEGIAWIV